MSKSAMIPMPLSIASNFHRDPQKEISNWRKLTFGVPSGDKPTLIGNQIKRMLKELDELKAASQDLLLADTEYLRNCVKKEMCDVLVTMFSVADEMEFVLLLEVLYVHWTNMNREWKSHGDGTGQHVKKAPWELER